MLIPTFLLTSLCPLLPELLREPGRDRGLPFLKPLPPRIQFPPPNKMIDWDHYIKLNETILEDMKAKKVAPDLIRAMQSNTDELKRLRDKYAK